MNQVPLDFADRNVCVLGLGFVGVTLATTMAEVGFQVTGIEIRDEIVDNLSSGNVHFFEPGLTTKLKKVISNGSLKVYKNIPPACDSTVFIITVGTPLDETKQINLNSIRNICQDISGHLKNGSLVILRSTVKLGTTRSVVAPLLQKTGKSFDIAFCPERTVEGQAMEELRFLPQIIGADNLATSIRASHLFQFITPTIVKVSGLETAEMIKLIDNTKRDVIFGFSNEVARMCDAAKLSAKEVISAGRFGYSRTDLPIPGPVGGPCLSKDSHILAQSMQEYGITPAITLAARKVNEELPVESVRFLNTLIPKEMLLKPMTISLLGIAFKGVPATDDTRGTTARAVLDTLKKKFPNGHFLGYDPVVGMSAIEEFGLLPMNDLHEVLRKSQIVLILNNHPLFSTIPLEKWAHDMQKPAIIYDFWNNFSRNNLCLPEGVQYIALGSHNLAKGAP